MQKLLIVDDEYLVREGLSQTIDWQALGLEVSGTAENGLAGLQLARAIKPDLIISDVRMPVMDGLDMAKTLFSEGADLAVIVYSGYKDFEYAHRALESNVAGFLLKPIENEKLVAKVAEVLQKLNERRHRGKLLGQFEKNAPILKKQLLNSLLRGLAPSASILEQLSLLDVKVPERGTLIYFRSKNGVPEEVAKTVCGEFEGFNPIYEIFDNYCVIITSFGDEQSAVKKTVKVLDGILQTDNRFSVGLTSFENNLPEAFETAENLSKNALYTAINAVATKDDGGNKYKKLIRDALKIIESDYDKKISVRSVAEALYTSESHLMHEFKEQTGKTFNSCLTDFRILKAEELLLEGKMRVGEVAYAVGYNDVKYFGQVFKEETGKTPSEFIQSRINEDKNF